MHTLILGLYIDIQEFGSNRRIFLNDNNMQTDIKNLRAVAWDFQQCGVCDHTRSLIRAFPSRLNIL